MIKKIIAPTVSAVATTAFVASRPFGVQNASAEVVLGAGSGTVSIQFAGSNDGTNYTSIGSAVTATDRAVALSSTNLVYQFYRATTIISTNTKVTDITFNFI
jgi:hypothetical protein